ncbi:MAG TPA: hypothetical protein VMV92_39230 [Streptosporangiaceae bacterium]|nr:hypothetical protein [Streptosporangiaceae bacterium]
MTRVRDEFRDLWRETCGAWADARSEWAALAQEIRESRRLRRLGDQLITGKTDPARKEVRRAARAISSEVRELERIARRVIAEHRKNGHSGETS